jgi:hypothetical protein
VHRAPVDLPAIPVKRGASRAAATYIAGDRADDRFTRKHLIPVSLSISSEDGIEHSTVHEVGHFLDHVAIGDPNSFATSTLHRGEPDHPLRAWRDTVDQTDMVRRLRRMRDDVFSDREAHAERNEQGRIVRRCKYDDLDYLLGSDELLARAYAQYITLRSGDEVLVGQLDSERRVSQFGITLPFQWSDADFEPVAAALDDHLDRLGFERAASAPVGV